MVQYVFTPWRDRQELLLVRDQFYGSEALMQASGRGQARSGAASGQQQSRRRVEDADAEEEGEGLDQDQRQDQGDARRRTTAAAAATAAAKHHQTSREQGDGERQHKAVGRVSMWMQRGNCPHMVESTALLMAAVLSDEAAATGNAGASTYAVRAAYAAAFSRFVTGLLDGHQDKLRKQSMYSIAKNIGLPATFVELRHQATHEQLPSLAKLRSAARKALVWIWDYYWKHLGEAEKAKDPCKELVLSYLREDDEAARQKVMRQLLQWDMDYLQKTINELQRTLPGNQVFLKCLKLSQEMAALAVEQANNPGPEESGMPEEQEQEPGQEPDRGSEPKSTGWSRYSGAWKPKPIGVLTKSRKMHIQSIPMWVGSSNNYAYLVIDDKSKDAVIIDPANPPEVAPVLKDAISSGRINLTAIVNTHHHWDHAGGNKKLLSELGTENLAIIGGKDCEGVTRTPKHEETFKIGDISVKPVHTPCHTQDSICYYMEDSTGKAVFTGDTLFISGCGKFFEGNGAEMHEALNNRLGALPDDTVVYPGHEYTKSNVRFTISVSQTEPIKSLQAFADNNEVTTGKFTIGDEKPRAQAASPDSTPVTSTCIYLRDKSPIRPIPNLFFASRSPPAAARLISQGIKARLHMPPKRRAGGPSTAPKPRQSKLAKEHNVSAQEEGEIKEAFSLFAEPMDGEKNGVLPINDVKSALIALGIPPSSTAELHEFISILDPDNDGYATYEPFFAICALKFHAREDNTDAHREELAEAFQLFTNGHEGPITLAHLRRVAAVLKEDVDEELLKDMILEANGGVGVARGVEMDEFDSVMRSAGVWR
ncbi:hydroxyacylglutathione hydrolase [Trichoderma arundinaceum]|uniref:hydroxyacylglutathione hydrolase n=1 Tax=Trichoderma arundinaceum TaxID=490622 RepID=A0A395NAF5_TRIAR|nr:hydroxyacylglutathione hydrolase [Trichoderma arundinaceum]